MTKINGSKTICFHWFCELFSNVLRLVVISSTKKQACWLRRWCFAFDEAIPIEKKWPIHVEHRSFVVNALFTENDYHLTPLETIMTSQFLMCTSSTIPRAMLHSKYERNNKTFYWKRWRNERKKHTCNLSNENLRKRSYQTVNSNFLLLWNI